MGTTGVTSAALSRREREVAALVAEGLTNRAIAERMFISERTVDGHLEHIRQKLGVTSRAQVAAWFVAQPPPTAVTAVGSPPGVTRPRQSYNVLLLVAALSVLALVAALVVPRLAAPTTPGGSALVSFTGVAPAQFNGPRSVAIGNDGYIYVADTDGYAIRKFDPKRAGIALVAGGTASGSFVDGADALTFIGTPTGVAVDPSGVVFFANGDLVARIDTNQTLHVLVADSQLNPVAVALGIDGTLYIADRGGNRVWRRWPSGKLTPVAGSGRFGYGGDGASALDAELTAPTSVAVDASGNVLIADEGNNRIRRVDARSGVITTIAGSNAIYGFGGDGGPADLARLSLPLGVAVAANGDVYISDTGNDRVRRLDKNLRITTVAGAGGELYGPGGLAIASSGDLFVADIGDNAVVLVRGAAK